MSQERRPRYDRVSDNSLRPPRTAASRSPSPASSTASTELSNSASEARESDSSYTTDFDDLYDVSDDDSAIVPIKCSNSIKQLLSRNDLRRESLPSLVIPSPSAWPTIQKLHSAKSEEPPPLPSKLPLSPAVLAKLASQTLRVPGKNSTPSLDDGSSNSDDPASLSPSTPDLQARAGDVGWELPVQLTKQAMDTLQHLSPEFINGEQGTIISASQDQPDEMQERGLNISLVAPPPRPGQHKPPQLAINPPPSEPVSAISVPSPGGFFASLDRTSKRTWSCAKPPTDQPSTTTAECFYDVPWDHHISEVKEHVVEIRNEDGSEGPPTARQEQFTARRSEERVGPHEMVIRTDQRYDYDEDYERKLHATAAGNMSRTSLWLNAQEQYFSALKGANPVNATVDESSVSQAARAQFMSPTDSLPSHSTFSPSKKALRFVEPSKPKTPLTAIRIPPTAPASDPLFYHAFQHLVAHARAVDAYGMRQLRADALQAQRLHLPEVHRAQLLGQYAVRVPVRPEKDFGHLPSAPNDPATQKHREEVARVERERNALQQVSLAMWHLEACKFLSGGSLLPRIATEALAKAKSAGRTARVLDLGGLPTADWGWAVALGDRDVTVYTAIVTPFQDDISKETQEATAHWSPHRTPSNHRILTVSSPYRLPFPSGSFDVISARTLATLCRTIKPASPPSQAEPFSSVKSPLEEFDLPFASDFGGANRGALPSSARTVSGYSDEFVAVLAECKRILAPGGVLAYEYLDAEVVAASAPSTRVRKDSAVSVSVSPPNPKSEKQQNRSRSKSLHAKSVEFAVALRQASYDPSAGHRSFPRLLEAGFKKQQIRETALELPVGGSEDSVGSISEVAGAVKWERWILGTRGVKGLEGVGKALESARKNDGERWAWRERKGLVTV